MTTTAERLRETEERLDRANQALDAAEQAVGSAAEAAEAVERWRSDPRAIAVAGTVLAAVIALIVWLVVRSDD
jgi:uncharacterized protein (DUF3084 family)